MQDPLLYERRHRHIEEGAELGPHRHRLPPPSSSAVLFDEPVNTTTTGPPMNPFSSRSEPSSPPFTCTPAQPPSYAVPTRPFPSRPPRRRARSSPPPAPPPPSTESSSHDEPVTWRNPLVHPSAPSPTSLLRKKQSTEASHPSSSAVIAVEPRGGLSSRSPRHRRSSARLAPSLPMLDSVAFPCFPSAPQALTSRSARYALPSPHERDETTATAVVQPKKTFKKRHPNALAMEGPPGNPFSTGTALSAPGRRCRRQAFSWSSSRSSSLVHPPPARLSLMPDSPRNWKAQSKDTTTTRSSEQSDPHRHEAHASESKKTTTTERKGRYPEKCVLQPIRSTVALPATPPLPVTVHTKGNVSSPPSPPVEYEKKTKRSSMMMASAPLAFPGSAPTNLPLFPRVSPRYGGKPTPLLATTTTTMPLPMPSERVVSPPLVVSPASDGMRTTPSMATPPEDPSSAALLLLHPPPFVLMKSPAGRHGTPKKKRVGSRAEHVNHIRHDRGGGGGGEEGKRQETGNTHPSPRQEEGKDVLLSARLLHHLTAAETSHSKKKTKKNATSRLAAAAVNPPSSISRFPSSSAKPPSSSLPPPLSSHSSCAGSSSLGLSDSFATPPPPPKEWSTPLYPSASSTLVQGIPTSEEDRRHAPSEPSPLQNPSPPLSSSWQEERREGTKKQNRSPIPPATSRVSFFSHVWSRFHASQEKGVTLPSPTHPIAAEEIVGKRENETEKDKKSTKRPHSKPGRTKHAVQTESPDNIKDVVARLIRADTKGELHMEVEQSGENVQIPTHHHKKEEEAIPNGWVQDDGPSHPSTRRFNGLPEGEATTTTPATKPSPLSRGVLPWTSSVSPLSSTVKVRTRQFIPYVASAILAGNTTSLLQLLQLYRLVSGRWRRNIREGISSEDEKRGDNGEDGPPPGSVSSSSAWFFSHLSTSLLSSPLGSFSVKLFLFKGGPRVILQDEEEEDEDANSWVTEEEEKVDACGSPLDPALPPLPSSRFPVSSLSRKSRTKLKSYATPHGHPPRQGDARGGGASRKMLSFFSLSTWRRKHHRQRRHPCSQGVVPPPPLHPVSSTPAVGSSSRAQAAAVSSYAKYQQLWIGLQHRRKQWRQWQKEMIAFTALRDGNAAPESSSSSVKTKKATTTTTSALLSSSTPPPPSHDRFVRNFHRPSSTDPYSPEMLFRQLVATVAAAEASPFLVDQVFDTSTGHTLMHLAVLTERLDVVDVCMQDYYYYYADDDYDRSVATLPETSTRHLSQAPEHHHQSSPSSEGIGTGGVRYREGGPHLIEDVSSHTPLTLAMQHVPSRVMALWEVAVALDVAQYKREMEAQPHPPTPPSCKKDLLDEMKRVEEKRNERDVVLSETRAPLASLGPHSQHQEREMRRPSQTSSSPLPTSASAWRQQALQAFRRQQRGIYRTSFQFRHTLLHFAVMVVSENAPSWWETSFATCSRCRTTTMTTASTSSFHGRRAFLEQLIEVYSMDPCQVNWIDFTPLQWARAFQEPLIATAAAAVFEATPTGVPTNPTTSSSSEGRCPFGRRVEKTWSVAKRKEHAWRRGRAMVVEMMQYLERKAVERSRVAHPVKNEKEPGSMPKKEKKGPRSISQLMERVVLQFVTVPPRRWDLSCCSRSIGCAKAEEGKRRDDKDGVASSSSFSFSVQVLPSDDPSMSQQLTTTTALPDEKKPLPSRSAGAVSKSKNPPYPNARRTLGKSTSTSPFCAPSYFRLPLFHMSVVTTAVDRQRWRLQSLMSRLVLLGLLVLFHMLEYLLDTAGVVESRWDGGLWGMVIQTLFFHWSLDPFFMGFLRVGLWVFGACVVGYWLFPWLVGNVLGMRLLRLPILGATSMEEKKFMFRHFGPTFYFMYDASRRYQVLLRPIGVVGGTYLAGTVFNVVGLRYFYPASYTLWAHLSSYVGLPQQGLDSWRWMWKVAARHEATSPFFSASSTLSASSSSSFWSDSGTGGEGNTTMVHPSPWCAILETGAFTPFPKEATYTSWWLCFWGFTIALDILVLVYVMELMFQQGALGAYLPHYTYDRFAHQVDTLWRRWGGGGGGKEKEMEMVVKEEENEDGETSPSQHSLSKPPYPSSSAGRLVPDPSLVFPSLLHPSSSFCSSLLFYRVRVFWMVLLLLWLCGAAPFFIASGYFFLHSSSSSTTSLPPLVVMGNTHPTLLSSAAPLANILSLASALSPILTGGIIAKCFGCIFVASMAIFLLSFVALQEWNGPRHAPHPALAYPGIGTLFTPYAFGSPSASATFQVDEEETKNESEPSIPAPSAILPPEYRHPSLVLLLLLLLLATLDARAIMQHIRVLVEWNGWYRGVGILQGLLSEEGGVSASTTMALASSETTSSITSFAYFYTPASPSMMDSSSLSNALSPAMVVGLIFATLPAWGGGVCWVWWMYLSTSLRVLRRVLQQEARKEKPIHEKDRIVIPTSLSGPMSTTMGTTRTGQKQGGEGFLLFRLQLAAMRAVGYETWKSWCMGRHHFSIPVPAVFGAFHYLRPDFPCWKQLQQPLLAILLSSSFAVASSSFRTSLLASTSLVEERQVNGDDAPEDQRWWWWSWGIFRSREEEEVGYYREAAEVLLRALHAPDPDLYVALLKRWRRDGNGNGRRGG